MIEIRTAQEIRVNASPSWSHRCPQNTVVLVSPRVQPRKWISQTQKKANVIFSTNFVTNFPVFSLFLIPFSTAVFFECFFAATDQTMEGIPEQDQSIGCKLNIVKYTSFSITQSFSFTEKVYSRGFTDKQR